MILKKGDKVDNDLYHMNKKIRKHFNKSVGKFFKVYEKYICGDLYRIENESYFIGKKGVFLVVAVYQRYTLSSIGKFVYKRGFFAPMKFFLKDCNESIIINWLDKNNHIPLEHSAYELRNACRAKVYIQASQDRAKLADKPFIPSEDEKIDKKVKLRMQILDIFDTDIDGLRQLVNTPVKEWGSNI